MNYLFSLTYRNEIFRYDKLLLILSALLSVTIIDVAFSTELNHQLVTIKEACDNNLDFNSIREFESFIKLYKSINEEQLKLAKVSKDCQTDREAILELERLISKQDVCDSYKIDDLISYHKKFFSASNFLNLGKPITNKFFTKYAVQVAYTCKKNLFKNLELAREELKARNKTFEEARDKVYNQEPIIKSNIKLIQDQPNIPASSNVRPQDEAELTMSEYREALVKLERPEDILTFDVDSCKANKNHETIISKDKVQLFFKPSLMCHQLHRYYAGSILSIARLANYGYVAWVEELDSRIVNDSSVRDWVIAVQVCEPMLYMNTKEFKDDMAIIDTCTEKLTPIEMMVYTNDVIDELDIQLLEKIIPKSKATKGDAQKLMKSAYKRMAKIDIIQQLKSGSSRRSVFSKSMSMLRGGTSMSTMNMSGEKDSSINGKSFSKFAIQLGTDLSSNKNSDSSSILLKGGNSKNLDDNYLKKDLSDDDSYEILKDFVEQKRANRKSEKSDNGIDAPVAFIDPLSALATTLTVLAIMLSFEWLFFIIMTLAARICTHFHFNFGNILTFPPKFLSWSDADFASYNEKMEKMDEDDFFDYDELNQDEKQQRDLLNKLFGKPPPMLYRE